MAIKFRMADGMVVEFDTVEEAKAFGVDADEQGVDDSLSLSDIGEGDYVRFKTDYTDFADDFVSAGSLAVVDLIDSWDGHVSVHVGGKPWGFSVVWVDFKDVSTTLELVEEETEEPVFEAGDYVRVKSLDGFMGGFRVGELVKVVDGEVNVKTGHIKVSKLSFEGYGYPNPSDVEKAELTDREKAFIKVGREIGEFKHGDIVNVDEEFSDGSDDAKEGLAEVRDGGIKASLVRQPESLTTIDAFGHHHLDKLTLICPVEQRLDIGDDADV